MKKDKYGIFYFKNKPKKERKYWIGTFTKDRTACEETVSTSITTIKQAKQICKILNNQ